MAVYFQLFEKNHLGPVPAEPVSFQEIDALMCAHFGKEVSPTKYLLSWYDSVGLLLACGKSFEEIRTTYTELQAEYPEDTWPTETLNIINWLDDNYVANCWWSL